MMRSKKQHKNFVTWTFFHWSFSLLGNISHTATLSSIQKYAECLYYHFIVALIVCVHTLYIYLIIYKWFQFNCNTPIIMVLYFPYKDKSVVMTVDTELYLASAIFQSSSVFTSINISRPNTKCASKNICAK